MKCAYCGKELPDSAVFCSGCGQRVIKEATSPNEETISTPTDDANSTQKEDTNSVSNDEMNSIPKDAANSMQGQQADTYSQSNTERKSNNEYVPTNYGTQNQRSSNYAAPNYGTPNYGTPNYGPSNYGSPNYGYNMQPQNYNNHNIPNDGMDYTPISMWGYFGYELLFTIPCLGQILLLVFALGGTKNINLRNFARSFFCLIIISVAMVLLMSFLGFGILANL